jgi:hypothetical protein
MDYNDINRQTAKALQQNRQSNIFTNNWEESGRLIASLAVPKKSLDNLQLEADEESFIAKSALFPKLIEQVQIDSLSLTDLILMSQAAKAVEEGDSKAATFIRDTSGGKPADKVEQKSTNIAQLSDSQVKYLLAHAKVEDE